MERRRARSDLLHANNPFQVVGEDKIRGIAGRLRIKQRECALSAHPELPFPVVRILVQVLLDRYRAVRRFLGVLLVDLVTSGRSLRLRRGGPTADADTAGNEQADPRCPTLHFLAPLIFTRLVAHVPSSFIVGALAAAFVRLPLWVKLRRTQ